MLFSILVVPFSSLALLRFLAILSRSLLPVVLLGAMLVGAPVITSQTPSRILKQGAAVELEVIVTGSADTRFQWYEGASGDTAHPIAGATQKSLAILSATKAEGYWVRISDATGQTDSKAIVLLPLREMQVGEANQYPKGISYANGRFYYFKGEKLMFTSSDGVAWAQYTRVHTPSPSGTIFKVIYGNGRYLLGGSRDGYVSADGLEWERLGLKEEAAITFADGRFVAATTSGSILSSVDGLKWTTHVKPYVSWEGDPVQRQFTTLSRQNGRWLAGGYFSNHYLSSDGIQWELLHQPPFTISDLAAGLGRFVTTSSRYEDRNQLDFWSSQDGRQWIRTQGRGADGAPLYDVGAGKLVFTGRFFLCVAGRSMLVSWDGIGWDEARDMPPTWIQGIASNGRQVVFSTYESTVYTLDLARPAASPVVQLEQPREVFVREGMSAQLQLTTAEPGVGVQWYRGERGDTSQPVAGATVLSWDTGPLATDGRFWARTSAGDEVVDNDSIAVRIARLPAITSPQRAWEVLEGAAIEMSLEIADGAPFTVQWYLGKRGDVSMPLAGETAKTLKIVAGNKPQFYWARVTNIVGSTDSENYSYVPWRMEKSATWMSWSQWCSGRLFGFSGRNIYEHVGDLQWKQVSDLWSYGTPYSLERFAGRWFAGGGSVGRLGVLTSPDLAQWSQVPLQHDGVALNVRYWVSSPQRLVGFADGSICTTTDGLEWLCYASPDNSNIVAVAYGNGRFAAIGTRTDPVTGKTGLPSIYFSTDGLAWERASDRIFPANNPDLHFALGGIVYLKGKFIIYPSTSGEAIAVSEDASSWVRIGCPRVQFDVGKPIAEVGDYLLIGRGGKYYLLSRDGWTWTEMGGPEYLATGSFTKVGGTLFASDGRVSISSTENGTDWKLVAGPMNNGEPKSFVGGYGTYVERIDDGFSNSSDGRVSEDGVKWCDGNLRDVGLRAFGNGVYFGISGYSKRGWYSKNGMYWTPIAEETPAFYSANFESGRFFGLSQNSTLLSSLDGIRWNEGSGKIQSLVGHCNDRFFAYSTSGSLVSLLSSTDGNAWVPVWGNVTYTGTPVNIVYGGGNYALLTKNGEIALSANLQIWKTYRCDQSSSPLLSRLFHTGDRYLLKGSEGVGVSPTGESWGFGGLVGAETLNFANGRYFAKLAKGLAIRVPDGLHPCIVSADVPSFVPKGQTVALRLKAEGAELQYQWYEGKPGDTSKPVGGNAAILTIQALERTMSYWVRVKNAFGSVESGEYLVSVAGPPEIVHQPIAGNASSNPVIGAPSEMIQVTARGMPPLRYQWYRGFSGDTSRPVPGEQRSSLFFGSTMDVGRYWVRITNDLGSVDSATILATDWGSLDFNGFEVKDILYAKEAFIVAATRIYDGAGCLLVTTTEGASWQYIPTDNMRSICASKDLVVGLSINEGPKFFQSTDLENWELVQSPLGPSNVRNASQAGGMVFVSYENGSIASVREGKNWRFQQVSDGRLNEVAYGNGVYVLCGDKGRLFRSVDGEAWQAIATADARDLYSVAYGNGRFVLLRTDGSGLWSSNGLAWQELEIRAADSSTRVSTYSPIRFSLGSFRIPHLISSDGEVWERDVPASREATDGRLVLSFARRGIDYYRELGVVLYTWIGTFLPRILTQPTAAFGGEGTTFSLNVSVSASPDTTYQWRKNGVPLVDGNGVQGASTHQLILLRVDAADAGSYDLVMTNAAGKRTSATIPVTIVQPPSITRQPGKQMVKLGRSFELSVEVSGGGPPSYQWLRNGLAIVGATSATYSVAATTLADAGVYRVRVTAESGSVLSEPASVSVRTEALEASHRVLSRPFAPGGEVKVECSIHHEGAWSSLQWQVLLPSNWKFLRGEGSQGGAAPTAGTSDLLEWRWTAIPASPIVFSYFLRAPENVASDASLAALASGIMTADGETAQLTAKPDPLPLICDNRHAADTNFNWHIDDGELGRVIELYDTRCDGRRTGAYIVAAGTIDGFAADPIRPIDGTVVPTRWHSADTNRDGRLGLEELTRLIQLRNTRTEGARTGVYHLRRAGEEQVDGFAPGP